MKIFAKAPDGGGQWRSRQIFCVVFSSLLSAGAAAQTGPRSVLPGAGTAQSATSPSDLAKYIDVTSALNINFEYVASHTSRKYLIETMGSGVALFDYDNDGRLDIFVVNGAPLSDPTPKGTIPKKVGPKDWNRLFRQKKDGTFEDVTEKAGLHGVGYGMGVAVGDYDNDGFEDLYVTAYGGNRLYHNNGDGTFTDATERAGVAGSGWSTSATAGYAGTLSCIGKCSVAIVVIKPVPAVCGHVQVFKSVIVVIADGDSHSVTYSVQPGFLSYVFECAVFFLVEKPIPILWARFFRNRPFGRGIAERSAVDHKNVQAPIVVVVKQGNAGSHGFDQVFSRGVRSDVLKIYVQRGSYIDVLCNVGCRSCGLRRAGPREN